MIGEAVHSIVEEEDIASVLSIFKKFIPTNQIILTDLSLNPITILEDKHITVESTI